MRQRVTGMPREGSAWRVETAGGHVSAQTVILTVNGHLESFGVETGRLMQLFLFAVMTPRSSMRTRWRGSAGGPAGASRRRTRWAPRCAGSNGGRAATGS
jgi:hypothetical protein